MRRLSKIIRIANRCKDLIKIEGYAVFEDDWIRECDNLLINENGQEFNVLGYRKIEETVFESMGFI
jgi:hypothetical protein